MENRSLEIMLLTFSYRMWKNMRKRVNGNFHFGSELFISEKEMRRMEMRMEKLKSSRKRKV